MLLGGAGVWQAYGERSQIKEIRTSGVETEGKVVDSSRRKRKRSFAHYYLTVEFQPGGREKLVIEKEVSEQAYDQGRENGVVPVRYVPSNPETCAFGEPVGGTWKDFLTGFGLAGLGLAVIVIVSLEGREKSDAEIKTDAVNNSGAGQLESFTYAMVTDPVTEFPWVDHDFYDRARKQLEEYGFRFLGDEKITNVKLSSFGRYLVSEDGVMYAVCFYHRPGTLAGMLGAKESRSVEFCSALTNGTFISTGNAENLSGVQYPDIVDAEQLAADTPIPELLSRHRRRVQKQLGDGAEVVMVQSLEQAHRVGNAEQKVKARWRKNQGIDARELRGIAVEALGVSQSTRTT